MDAGKIKKFGGYTTAQLYRFLESDYPLPPTAELAEAIKAEIERRKNIT